MMLLYKFWLRVAYGIKIGAKWTLKGRPLIRVGGAGSRITIGDGAVVGVGAVVTKDVPVGARVSGNPAEIRG